MQTFRPTSSSSFSLSKVRELSFRCLFLASACVLCGIAGAQAGTSASAGPSKAPRNGIELSASLTGAPETGLQPGELTLLDNGVPAAGQSSRLISPEDPVHVILVIDDVNARLTTIAFERSELKKFFKKRDGRLRAPFSIAFLTDRKLDIQNEFSQGGNRNDDLLQNYDVGLHEFARDAQYGGEERTNICLRALDQLVAFASGVPGRKLIIFVSPGWPLLSGPRVDLSSRQQTQIFNSVVRLQDTMLRSRITLDMVNPFGPTERLERSDYYLSFTKGVRAPKDVDIADLSLQVLATHTGGLVLQGTTDVGAMVERSLNASLDQNYAIDFVPREAEKPSELHHLQLRVNRPGVTAVLPDEYYAQPAAAAK